MKLPKLPQCPKCGGKYIGVIEDSIRNFTIYRLCCINEGCSNPETKWSFSVEEAVEEWTNEVIETMTPEKILRTLCEHGYKAYIVGGSVRDTLDGTESNDIDIATNATPEQVLALFPHGKPKKAGSRFAVVFLGDIQVATFRKDTQVKFYSAKEVEVEYSDYIEEDVRRRDLTINSMAACPISGDIVDLFGGADDLRNRVIRMVGDPEERIVQDPTRVLRACRFLAKINGKFEMNTLRAMQKFAGVVKAHVHPEMIRYEFIRAMETDTPSLFFSALHLTGVLKTLIPEMDDAYEFTGGEHHLETVWEHLMLTGDNIRKRSPILRLAGFLHDVGKPMSYKYHNDGSFCGHEMIGGNICRSRLPQLGFSPNEVDRIAGLIEAHMRVCLSLSPKAQRRLRKYLEDSGVDPRDYLRLKIADRSGNLLRSKTEIAPVKGFLRAVGLRGKEVVPMTTKDLALSGGELINLLGLMPGPLVGKTQKYLLALVVDNPEMNTRETLLNEAANYVRAY